MLKRLLGIRKKVTTTEAAQHMYEMFMQNLRWEHERTPVEVQKFKESRIDFDREALTNELVPIYLLFLDVVTKSTFPLHTTEILEGFYYILRRVWSENDIDGVFGSLQGYLKVWGEALRTTDPDATELLKDPVYRVSKLACERVIDDDAGIHQIMATYGVVQGRMQGLIQMFNDYSKRHEVVSDPEKHK